MRPSQALEGTEDEDDTCNDLAHVPARRGRILAVDDDESTRWLIAHTLRLDGFDVTPAPDGAAARAILAECETDLDVIILDVRLPEIGGLAVLAGVRASGSQVPVVVITAYETAGIRRLAEMLDATAVLAKPFDVARLRMTVMNIVEKPR